MHRPMADPVRGSWVMWSAKGVWTCLTYLKIKGQTLNPNLVIKRRRLRFLYYKL